MTVRYADAGPLAAERRRWLASSGLALAALAAGCATPANDGKPVAKGPFLYPPPPALPRIQHLLALSGQRDLGAPRSGFADFVAGKEKNALTMTQPYGVAIHRNRVYAADPGGPGLVLFDFDTRKVSTFTGSGAGRMKRPVNLAIDADGSKYVADSALDQVLLFDAENRFVRAFGGPDKFRPVDVAVRGERLYVVDIGNHQVHVLNKRSGGLLFRFGGVGQQPGQMVQPTNIAIGPGGDLYVTETGNFRVQRFTADGKPLRTYGEAGNVPGTFARPKGIAVDRAGRLYVADAAIQNVQVFTDDGRLLMDFGRPLEGLDGMSLPAAVKIDYDHVPLFQPYADPKFKVEHLVLVVSQFAPTKVDVYGFGRLTGVDYDAPPRPAQT